MAPDESSTWLKDILITKDLLSRMAMSNRLAERCLALFKRLSPLFDSDVPQDLGLWDGNYTTGFPGDQVSEGFWDWANSEMNWTI
jgi:transcriptional regulatory protein GAL4